MPLVVSAISVKSLVIGLKNRLLMGSKSWRTKEILSRPWRSATEFVRQVTGKTTKVWLVKKSIELCAKNWPFTFVRPKLLVATTVLVNEMMFVINGARILMSQKLLGRIKNSPETELVTKVLVKLLVTKTLPAGAHGALVITDVWMLTKL